MDQSHSTFIKDKFKGTWDRSAKKEAFVRECIERFAEKTVLDEGFGAGSTAYIEGTSADHGHEKAAPDLRIQGTDLCIEVTGPLRSIFVNENTDLLVNLSKVKYALRHPDLEYWIAWVNGVTSKRQNVRMIRIGEQFRTAVDRAEICRTQFKHRDFMQKFWAIPNDHHTVISFDLFLRYLKHR